MLLKFGIRTVQLSTKTIMTPNVFFSSDLHFYHANIIKYCKRPFASVEEMNEGLIANHNSLVKPNDVWYHLGDFAFAGSDEIRQVLRRMNGIKHFVKGNHDKAVNFVGLVESFSADLCLKFNGIRYHLYHFPVSSWDSAHHGSIHLHGHSHGSTNSDGLLRFDMGVDCNNMFPFSLEQVEALVKQRREDLRAAKENLTLLSGPATLSRETITQVNDLLTRLQVGGCTCLTKTPDIRHHDARCTYRLASEVHNLINPNLKNGSA